MEFDENQQQRSPVSRPSSSGSVPDRPNASPLAEPTETEGAPSAGGQSRQQASSYSIRQLNSQDVEAHEAIPLQPTSDSAAQNSSSSSSARSKTNQLPKQRQRSSWIRLWAWELLGAVFSVSCMAGVIAILTSIQHKALNDWKLPISPNALVAVFTTLAKSSLLLIVAEGISQLKWIYFQERRHRLFDLQLFDAASRGPWGALQLLYSLRLHAVIASLGALLTILCLAMDPFSQQIISYNATMVNSSEATALVRNAQAYDDQYLPRLTNYDGNGDYYVHMNMTTAAFMGMFNAKASAEFQCSSGNCTFPEFESIGICCECTNETVKIVPQCQGTANRTFGQTCSYSLSPQLNLTAFFKNEPGAGPTIPVDNTELNTTVWTPQESEFDPNLAKILALTNADWFRPSKEWQWPRPSLYSCDLYLCKQRRTSVVTNGIITERVVDSQPLLFPKCTNSYQQPGPWFKPVYEVPVCPGFTEADMPPNINDLNATTLNDPKAMWINMADIQQIVDWFKNTFSVDIRESNRNNPGTALFTAMANMLYTLNDGNIMQTMEDVATALSNAMRQGPNSTWVSGYAQVPATVAHVRWPWFTLPASLVLLGIAFLGTAIAFSSEDGKFVWKSSILATVYHRLEGFTADEMDVRSIVEMEESARGMRVVLAEDIDGKVSLCK
ncbi:hypothetical protein HII31_01920 [Pseudocercospora fuligena]|uniref:Uncharacterized protein n=1 Tax=Pseudocercospora fuligena TaxID=685502 RepID=A0A8H6VRV2_9PEZI|nr:hypothetical protein HII31_01920 [Pseudocercospora fuligena]